MGMVMSEAKARCQPFMTARRVAQYKRQVDKGLWVEEFIMIPAGIHSSICTPFGEILCEWIEIEMDN